MELHYKYIIQNHNLHDGLCLEEVVDWLVTKTDVIRVNLHRQTITYIPF